MTGGAVGFHQHSHKNMSNALHDDVTTTVKGFFSSPL